jgi:hypothetical protein
LERFIIEKLWRKEMIIRIIWFFVGTIVGTLLMGIITGSRKIE